MQRDIDFKLILLILLVIIAIVGLTLFYQSSAGNIIKKYNKVSENLKRTQENMTMTLANLDICSKKVQNLTLELDSSLNYQLESQSEFNALYTDTKSSLEDTQTTLESTEEKLDDTKADLEQTENSLEDCQATNDANVEAANDADSYAESAQSKLDSCQSTCSGTDVASCQNCINDALGYINQVRNYLDEIEG